MRFTAAFLRSILDYSPATGEWRWRMSVGTARLGSRAGFLDEGYWIIRIKSHNYRAARLAVLYMTGRWPKRKVDHKNRNTSDDKWTNLREANNSQNAANCKRNTRNLSGYKGVRWKPSHNKWEARIRVNGKLLFLGLHATPELASAAYYKAAKKHFGEFAHAG